jgi:hypothetical protein
MTNSTVSKSCYCTPPFGGSGYARLYATFGLKFLEYIRKEYLDKNGLKDVLKYEIM